MLQDEDGGAVEGEGKKEPTNSWIIETLMLREASPMDDIVRVFRDFHVREKLNKGAACIFGILSSLLSVILALSNV